MRPSAFPAVAMRAPLLAAALSIVAVFAPANGLAAQATTAAGSSTQGSAAKPRKPKGAAALTAAPLLDGREGRVPQAGFGAAPGAGSVEPNGTLGGPLSNPPEQGGKAVSQASRAYGAYQRGYYLTAMNLALPEAEKGNASAQTLVAELFARGLGVARSMDDAAFWYGQAAKNGDPSAEFNYALLLMDGKFVKKDEAKAATLMKKAADAGIPSAAFNHAQSLVADDPGEKGIAAALPYYEKAAEAGIADAQYALSQIYRNSPGISDAKRARARYWLTRAAEAGYDTAELDLGIWLIDGVEGGKDYDAGFKWMKRAAESGNVMAENRLAHLYRNGIGTKQDRVAAAAWYIMARRAGLQDNELDGFYQGLTDDEQKQALKMANDLQTQ